MPVVTVQLKGMQVDFLVDTGSEYVTIDPVIGATISKSALSVLGPSPPQGGWTILDTLALKDLKVRNVPARVLDLSTIRLLTGGPIYGILGTAFFYHFVNEFDFVSRKITLKPKREDFESQDGDQLMLAADFVPFATATVDGHEGPLIIDTGVQDYGVVIQEVVADELGIERGCPSVACVATTASSISECRIGEVTMGGVTCLNPKSGVCPLGLPDYGFRILGLLGYGCMEHAIVTLDYANMRFRIQSSP
jgi:predicted aspartyl protease